MLGVIDQRQTVAAQACSLSLQEADCLAWSDDNRIALVTPPAIIIYVSTFDCVFFTRWQHEWFIKINM